MTPETRERHILHLGVDVHTIPREGLVGYRFIVKMEIPAIYFIGEKWGMLSGEIALFGESC